MIPGKSCGTERTQDTVSRNLPQITPLVSIYDNWSRLRPTQTK
jgi:hypothetical protein